MNKLPHPFVFRLSKERYEKIFGLKSKAKNFVIIFYKDGTHPSVLEQEKVESYWTICALSIPSILWFTLGGWWTLLSVPFLLVYPVAMVWHYPGSHVFRRFFEIRSHAREIRAWIAIEGHPDVVEIRAWRHAYGMSQHAAYNLKLSQTEIYNRLMRHL